jgi:hypothetical protein
VLSDDIYYAHIEQIKDSTVTAHSPEAVPVNSPCPAARNCNADLRESFSSFGLGISMQMH